MSDDKGKPIPVIFQKGRRNDSDSVELKMEHKKIDRRVFSQQQVGIDKIVEDSDSSFYITGKTTKIPFLNFIQLISRHDIGQVEGKEHEEMVVSSDLIMRIATADITDEDEEAMQYVDATAVGMFIAGFLLASFALISRNVEDITTLSWIVLLVSTLLLVHYTYKGAKSGDLQKYARAAMKSLTRK